MLKHSYYAKFITYLDWDSKTFSSLYHSGLLSQLRRLTELVPHLEYQGDITMLNGIIKASWSNMSTKLVLKFESNRISEPADCIIQLNDILQRNRKLLFWIFRLLMLERQPLLYFRNCFQNLILSVTQSLVPSWWGLL
ncbi:unnamed protein product [Ambrosiozyma monospora]|uniref:Unnamed protein product n=1 Tax=Ambrosiozyma monospora TaxID=43982 RepID=A0ACB5T834_AMBMO|nr:unnamed protein product [Ambrosiozyma monospora]